MDNRGSTRWVHAHAPGPLRYATSRIKGPEVTEGLVQLSFIAAWKGRRKFVQQSSPRAWLFSILKNKIADRWRKTYGP